MAVWQRGSRRDAISAEGGFRWTRRQWLALSLAASVAVAAALLWDWALLGAVIMTIGVAAYFVTVVFRAVVFMASGSGKGEVHLPATPLADDHCPPAVVLVAAYREAAVLPRLIASLAQMDYPRFDVLLVLEEHDRETIERAEAALASMQSVHTSGAAFRIVIVPASVPGPAGKPRALNYAADLCSDLLDESEFVVVFDAEDHPDPLQLRKAAQAFHQEGARVGGVQAELSPLNARRNWFTWMWAGLYANTYRVNMPGLSSLGSIVPLGGTSNYVRTEALRRVGKWDMFNVTEDLDLGVKLRRAGYRVLMLPSVTGEEATATFIDQVKQASRWMKGHAATAIAHLRNPVALWRDLGVVGSLGFFTFVVLPVPTTLLGPLFWALTGWYIAEQPQIIRAITPQLTLYLGLLCLAANALFVWQVMVAMRRARHYLLVPLMPLVLLYVQTVTFCATVKALAEILRGRLYYWDKTKHYGVVMPSERPALTIRHVATGNGGLVRRGHHRGAPVRHATYGDEHAALLVITCCSWLVARLTPNRVVRALLIAVPAVLTVVRLVRRASQVQR